jgi:hypothetical protein
VRQPYILRQLQPNLVGQTNVLRKPLYVRKPHLSMKPHLQIASDNYDIRQLSLSLVSHLGSSGSAGVPAVPATISMSEEAPITLFFS